MTTPKKRPVAALTSPDRDLDSQAPSKKKPKVAVPTLSKDTSYSTNNPEIPPRAPPPSPSITSPTLSDIADALFSLESITNSFIPK